MKLYCARHGEAAPAAKDDERELTPQGRLEVEKMAVHLHRCGIEINHVIFSPKRRAKQTAEIFAKTLNILDQHEIEGILDAEADVMPFVELLKNWTEDTLLVGHLPFLHKLVNQLVTHDSSQYPLIAYPPSGIVCLDYFEARRWIIQWHIVPNIVVA